MRVLDVCCGAGFFSYGFKQAGFEIDKGVDNWEPAIKTYSKYLDEKGKLVSIEDYYPSKKNYDIIVVGATPCQDFSRVNTKRNIFSKRAQLVLDFCRIVTSVQPEVFVFENVIGLSKWAEAALLEIKGYKVTKNIVNTEYYGVPQRRRRKIFIGAKNRHIQLVPPADYTKKTVADAFSTIKENWGYMDHREETVKKFSKITSTTWISKEPTSDYQGTIRLSWCSPACAITNVKKAQILHPQENRVITIAEAMALQGIPFWYVPEGTDTDKAVQVANAVPPKLAYNIALRVQNGEKKTQMFLLQ